MPEQAPLPFPKPRRHKASPLVAWRRGRNEHLEQARRIAAEPGEHCEGLRRWAELVLENESEVSR